MCVEARHFCSGGFIGFVEECRFEGNFWIESNNSWMECVNLWIEGENSWIKCYNFWIEYNNFWNGG